MASELKELFTNVVLAQRVTPKPTVITICNVGNWKALQPVVRIAFPKIALNSGVRHPVLLGGEAPIYLDKLGSAGAAQFKDNVRHVLENRERIIVFDAQKVDSLISDPTCIDDLIGPRQIAAFYFRDEISPAVADYLGNRRHKIEWVTPQVTPDGLGGDGDKNSLPNFGRRIRKRFASSHRTRTTSSSGHEEQIAHDSRARR